MRQSQRFLLRLGRNLVRPEVPVKTSDFESQGDGTRRKNAADRSTRGALHRLPLEGSATVRSHRVGSDLADLPQGGQASRQVSILPNRRTRGVTQRSPGVPLGGSAARFGTIAERDARGLIVKLQNNAPFHLVNRPELDSIAFKLDGHAHLGTRIASGDVPGTPTHPTNWRR